MKKLLIFALLFASFSPAVYAKRYIVTVQNDTRAPVDWEAFVTRSGGDVVKTYNFIDGALLDLTEEQAERLMSRKAAGLTIEEDISEYWLEDGDSSALGALRKQAADYGISHSVSPAAAVPSMSVEESEWEDGTEGSEYPWGISRVKASSAWKKTEGAGVKVAVIDSGINYKHEDLKDNYAGGINLSGDGDENDPIDGHGHGTHVAGIIAAAKNGKGVVGVAPKAKIYSVKVLRSDGYGDRSNVISGIEWAIENKMQVINMSLGSPQMTEAQQKAIKAAAAAGIIVVCSAGNRGPDGPMSYPGRYPETIAVSSSDRRDNISSFSSRGPEVDVIAPGTNVLSTTKDGKYNYKSGTSMACPHVSGLAALSIAAGLPADQFRKLLKDNAIKLKKLGPEEQGSGLANAAWIKKR